eukprot:658805-Prorocentrum_minimum.AAC.1
MLGIVGVHLCLLTNLLASVLQVVSVFQWACSVEGTGEISTMTAADWLTFVTFCDIPNPKSAGCKKHDCERIFMETNYTEESEKDSEIKQEIEGESEASKNPLRSTAASAYPIVWPVSSVCQQFASLRVANI